MALSAVTAAKESQGEYLGALWALDAPASLDRASVARPEAIMMAVYIQCIVWYLATSRGAACRQAVDAIDARMHDTFPGAQIN